MTVKKGPQKWRSKVDPKSGCQKWTPKVAVEKGPQKWRPKVDPKSGSRKRTPKVAAKSGPQKWRSRCYYPHRSKDSMSPVRGNFCDDIAYWVKRQNWIIGLLNIALIVCTQVQFSDFQNSKNTIISINKKYQRFCLMISYIVSRFTQNFRSSEQSGYF